MHVNNPETYGQTHWCSDDSGNEPPLTCRQNTAANLSNLEMSYFLKTKPKFQELTLTLNTYSQVLLDPKHQMTFHVEHLETRIT